MSLPVHSLVYDCWLEAVEYVVMIFGFLWLVHQVHELLFEGLPAHFDALQTKLRLRPLLQLDVNCRVESPSLVVRRNGACGVTGKEKSNLTLLFRGTIYYGATYLVIKSFVHKTARLIFGAILRRPTEASGLWSIEFFSKSLSFFGRNAWVFYRAIIFECKLHAI